MRLLGQRPRYQEGPPEGAGHVGWPLGGEEFSGPRPSRLVARPERPTPANPPASPRPPEDRRRRTSPESPRPGGSRSRGGAEPGGTPDRSKLFGSHGQRPWLHEVVTPEQKSAPVS